MTENSRPDYCNVILSPLRLMTRQHSTGAGPTHKIRARFYARLRVPRMYAKMVIMFGRDFNHLRVPWRFVRVIWFEATGNREVRRREPDP